MRRRTRLDQSTLLALIDGAYSAAEDATCWEPLLKSLSEAVGGTSACLISHDLVSSGTAVVMAGLHPDVVPLYNEHYHSVDAWALAPDTPWLARKYPTLEDDAVLLRTNLRKTEFYPYLLQYGISRMMHTTLRVAAQRVTSGLSIYRREADAGFCGAETRFLTALAPHLARALRLSDVLTGAAVQRDTALGALDALPLGVLLVTGEGHVLHANSAAAAILAVRDGLVLDRSLLTAAAPRLTSLIRRHCAECAKTTTGNGLNVGGAISLPRPSGARDLQLLVSPVRRTQALGLRHDRVAAIVFVSDRDREPLSNARVLQMLYGLTPAESTVAVLLAAGRSVAEISETCQYTRQTVQWYSKQILSKTGCRSRAALVRELAKPRTSLANVHSTGLRGN